jgi:predicted MPP superfamily phosphohydrolase
MVILALTPLAQAFWCAWAWRVIGAVAWPAPRYLLHGLWAVAGLGVLAAGLDLLGVRVLPRRALSPWGPAMAALPVAQAARVEAARRTAFRYAAALAGGLPLLAAAYGATAGRLRYRVLTVDVPLTNLPPQLEGLRIVHLSDLHIGDFMPRAAIQRAVDLANALRPELAVLTGDLLTSARDPLEDGVAEVSRLQAPLGVWGCHGNHERWAGVEARAQALFARSGMHVLRQPCVALSWRGGAIDLIGVDDQRERGRAGEPSSMLRGIAGLVRRDIPNILLSHNPDTFPRAAALGIELSLAGHTHGGQLRVALGRRQWSPASLLTPFVAGLYRLPLGPAGRGDNLASCAQKSAVLSVNRGLGTFGLPVRLGVPPEVTLLTLRATG